MDILVVLLSFFTTMRWYLTWWLTGWMIKALCDLEHLNDLQIKWYFGEVTSHNTLFANLDDFVALPHCKVMVFGSMFHLMIDHIFLWHGTDWPPNIASGGSLPIVHNFCLYQSNWCFLHSEVMVFCLIFYIMIIKICVWCGDDWPTNNWLGRSLPIV